MDAFAGAIGVSDSDGKASPVYSVLRPFDEGAADNSFYAYVLRHAAASGLIASLSKGIRERSTDFRYAVLREISLPVPPLEEQRAIVTYLDEQTAEIDALVERKQRLIELVRERRAGIITRAVTRGLNPSAPLIDSGVEWIGEAPAHWEIPKLGFLTTCFDRRRVPLNAEERGSQQGVYPYWGANGIVDHIDKWIFDEELILLGEDGAPFFDRTKPVAFVVNGRIWVNNHTHVLRARHDVVPSFLAHTLNSVDYRFYIGGSTRDKLTQDDMNRIRVILPPLHEQKAITSALASDTAKLDALQAGATSALDLLGELRAALITAAVTGQIDVRERPAAG